MRRRESRAQLGRDRVLACVGTCKNLAFAVWVGEARILFYTSVVLL